MLARKTIALQDVQIKVSGDGAGSFEGYASVFGGVDSYGDTIQRGAFAYTLKTHGKPKLLYGHDWYGLPIGKYTVAKEDDHGLFVAGEFTPGIARAQDVRAAMAHGTLDGLSVGGYVKAGDYEELEGGGRLIKRWTRLVEVSPVVFPADEAARVDVGSVKGADILEAIAELESARDLERLLRDAAGLSKGAATALVARAKKVLGVGDPRETQTKAMEDIAARLARLAESLNA